MSDPAGWYSQTDGQQRYWDGQEWTANWDPRVAPVATQADIPVHPWFKKQRFVLAGVALAFLVIVILDVALMTSR